ncbi:HAD family hydrolase, partial [Chloroflexota bacterium]
EDYFRATVYGREVKEGKPSPDVYLLAAGKLGVAPDRCLVIEDAVAGVAAAKRAGMKCLAVTNTSPAARLGEADLITDSLVKISVSDLRELFDSSKMPDNQ